MGQRAVVQWPLTGRPESRSIYNSSSFSPTVSSEQGVGFSLFVVVSPDYGSQFLNPTRATHKAKADIINIRKAPWAGGRWRVSSRAGLAYHRVRDTPASARGKEDWLRHENYTCGGGRGLLHVKQALYKFRLSSQRA
ncbi:hypothetical protein SRHO_G00150130 [Serrasalmus rhombeus]